MSSVISPLDQAYVYGEVPPDTERSAVPLPPIHVASVAVIIEESGSGSVKVIILVPGQPLLSVTLIVYVPGYNPIAVEVICPILQK